MLQQGDENREDLTAADYMRIPTYLGRLELYMRVVAFSR